MLFRSLMNMEAGEPSVSMGIYLTALWMMGRESALADLAAPAHDTGAIEMDVREAIELGRARARASAEARQVRKETREQ